VQLVQHGIGLLRGLAPNTTEHACVGHNIFSVFLGICFLVPALHHPDRVT
jgi:hypothetical protein